MISIEDLKHVLEHLPPWTNILVYDNGVASPAHKIHVSVLNGTYAVTLDADPNERSGLSWLPEMMTLKQIEEEFAIPKSTIRSSSLARTRLANGLPLLFARMDVKQYAVEREKRLHRRVTNAKKNTTEE
ncbi:hypothetical protein SEA_SIXAMA_185 [Gordonia phage Sixama]|uniref:Uncharacterized protein n=1 Tax=Gordonia phage Sixama TaxID=2653271 RepID=A0A5Q2F783_9CAUD|nr:hypothetical protein PP302_gp144 [Gordonia phage Sixama]QGF20335.1 hypothetical protein SEA_SIXAMA_185 [Gordonia phage Sixama]